MNDDMKNKLAGLICFVMINALVWAIMPILFATPNKNTQTDATEENQHIDETEETMTETVEPIKAEKLYVYIMDMETPAYTLGITNVYRSGPSSNYSRIDCEDGYEIYMYVSGMVAIYKDNQLVVMTDDALLTTNIYFEK